MCEKEDTTENAMITFRQKKLMVSYCQNKGADYTTEQLQGYGVCKQRVYRMERT